MENNWTFIVSLIQGLVMPLVVDFVNGKVCAEKRWLKWVITLGSCIVVGTFTTAVSLGFKPEFFALDNLLANIGIVFTASQAVFNVWYKDSKAREAIYNGNTVNE